MPSIQPLTGLRGVAALMVFVSHSAHADLLPSMLSNGYGHIGVMLFFVLSGFLMGYLYLDQPCDRANLSRYTWARVGRVLPLYFATLSIAVGLSLLLPEGTLWPFKFSGAEEILPAFALIKAKYVFWTVPVEVQFYVVFGLVWWLYQRQVHPLWIALLAVVTMLPTVFLIAVVRVEDLPRIVSTFAFAFFIGVFTAWLFPRLQRSAGLVKAANWLGLPLLVLMLLNFPVWRLEQGLVIHEQFWVRIWGDPITWALIWGTFVAAALNATSLKVLNWRPFQYLGEISYGFYLLHTPVLVYTSALLDLPALVELVIALAGTLALSQLSFVYFEQPLGRRLRQRANRPRASIQESVALQPVDRTA